MPTSSLQPAFAPKTQWSKFDGQTVVLENTATKAQHIDRAASAKANLAEMGRNVKDAFTPNHFSAIRDQGSNDIFGPAMTVILAPWAIAGEVLDVATLPVKLAKNGVDAVAHGVAAAADKIVFWK